MWSACPQSAGLLPCMSVFLFFNPLNSMRSQPPLPPIAPDCGVHYLWFAFVCFLIRSHPPIAPAPTSASTQVETTWYWTPVVQCGDPPAPPAPYPKGDRVPPAVPPGVLFQPLPPPPPATPQFVLLYCLSVCTINFQPHSNPHSLSRSHPPPPLRHTADPRSSQTGQVIQGLR